MLCFRTFLNAASLVLLSGLRAPSFLPHLFFTSSHCRRPLASSASTLRQAPQAALVLQGRRSQR